MGLQRKSAPQLIRITLFSILLTTTFLTACTSGDREAPATSGPNTTPLAQLHWCNGKPLMVFHDEGANPTATATGAQPATNSTSSTNTPTTLTNWDIVKTQLNFTVYLPANLPRGTCLISASGTIHDPIFGSSFTIGYLLPADDSINLSEAPAHMQSPTFQCSSTSASNAASKIAPPNADSSATTTAQAPVQICTGVQQGTSIVLAARGTTSDLKTFFQNLQANIDWVPGT
jgi:hypothetical protein